MGKNDGKYFMICWFLDVSSIYFVHPLHWSVGFSVCDTFVQDKIDRKRESEKIGDFES